MENKITINCPKCQTELSVDEALEAQITSRFRVQIEAENLQKLEAEKKKLWAIAQTKAAEKFQAESEKETKFLKEEILEKDKKLALAQEAELSLRKEKNRLEEEKKAFELEKQRQLDLERGKIREEAIKTFADEHRLRDAEAAKRLQDALKANEDLKRKLEQGSQQMQGVVLELELETTLSREFPLDQITPVPKGINGADIIQTVRDTNGKLCGAIAWESKRTKAWSEGWVQKLKDDQRIVKAEIAILMTQVLPEGMSNFGFKDGVYIVLPELALNLARFIRLQLIKISNIRSLEEGKSEKKEVIYNYLCGQEFRGRVEAIVEASISAKASLDREKRAFIKIWAEREKQIERIETNMIGMYGDMQGIAGRTLPQIKSLELTPGIDELVPSTELEDEVEDVSSGGEQGSAVSIQEQSLF